MNAPESHPNTGGVGFELPYMARAFVCKIASRCNLSCDYCYVYTYFDQSWREMPKTMTPATVDAVAQRLSDYVRATGQAEIEVILHGGEPLLVGERFLDRFVSSIRAAVEPSCQVRFTMQTNATLLDARTLKLLARLGVWTSVSLDGPPEYQDRHRRSANGKASSPDAERGARLLAEGYRSIFVGILAVIDLRNDPLATYEYLLSFEPPSVDFLFPDANFEKPPPQIRDHPSDVPYADWLGRIFDVWYESTSPTVVRTFDSIMTLAVGGPSWQDNLGLGEINLLTIETDGTFHDLDVLKSLVPGDPGLGMNVFDHSILEALASPRIRTHYEGIQFDGLAAECRACEVVRMCGGGYYGHRYARANGFNNPSVYSRDLKKLISHVVDRVHHDLGAAVSVR